MYECWTDGSYKPTVDQGGYAAIIVNNGKIVKKLYRGYKNTTNNRMELFGVIAALRWFIFPEEIIIYSDSQYIIESITKNRVQQWISENDESKKNLDLWIQILDLINFHNVSFKWVKGHNKNPMNELADLLAQHSAECLELPIDNGRIDD